MESIFILLLLKYPSELKTLNDTSGGAEVRHFTTLEKLAIGIFEDRVKAKKNRRTRTYRYNTFEYDCKTFELKKIPVPEIKLTQNGKEIF